LNHRLILLGPARQHLTRKPDADIVGNILPLLFGKRCLAVCCKSQRFIKRLFDAAQNLFALLPRTCRKIGNARF